MLAGLQQPTRVVLREDLSSLSNFAEDAAATSSASETTWVGEVEGLPGALSSVVLRLAAASATVHGNVRFWDDNKKGFGSFKVSNQNNMLTSI
jgi:hypothetical protein